MVFDKYAEFYDLLYQDKDYAGECSYLNSLIEEFSPTTKRILEFGSGTGIHGQMLADMGYHVSGIERSQAMIDFGKQRTTLPKVSNPQKDGSFQCVQGDCMTTKIGGDFDFALALFHVLSYQTTNEKVMTMLTNAHRQLKPKGFFIFDFWHEPAVRKIGPEVRVKKVQNDNWSITRIAEPECHGKRNLVKVHYQTFVEDRLSQGISKIEETHEMRAFDLDEISSFCKRTGFKLLHSEEWITRAEPSDETWGVCTILEKE